MKCLNSKAGPYQFRAVTGRDWKPGTGWLPQRLRRLGTKDVAKREVKSR